MDTDIDLLKRFGRRIRDLRTRLCISQEELAFRAGFHRTYVGMIERGERNITLSNMMKLANALKIRLNDLFE